MASFNVLAEEKKILRRKEKEMERKAKLEEKLKQGVLAGNVGKWADASDEEDDKLFRPVSDSETDSEDEDKEDEKVEVMVPTGTAKSSKDPPGVPRTSADTAKPEAAPSKGKKDRKQGKSAKDEEDIDNVLAEFGIEIDALQSGGASSSRRKKKKDKEATMTDDLADDKQEVKAADKQAPTAPVGDPEKESAEDETLDEAARQAALEALKKKAAAKAKKTAPDASKYAAAEAKKRVANHKQKKDKSMYDR